MLRHEFESKIVKGRAHVDIPTKYTISDFILTTKAPYSEKDDMSKAAFIDHETGAKLTYSELRKQIDQISSGLINNYNLVRGEVIAIFSPNSINFAIVLLAAMCVGITVTTINPMYTVFEASHQLEHSNTKLIVTAPDLHEIAKEAISLLNRPINIVSIDESKTDLDPFSSLFCDKPYNKLIFKEGECQETTAIIIYSSGTTGQPKGIVLSHYNLISNIIQIENALSEEDRETKHLLGLMPFYHIYGISTPILQGIHRHATIIPMKKFDLIKFLKAIEKYKLNFLTLAPPILLLLAKHPMIDNYDLSSLKRIWCGASCLPLDVANLVMNRLGCRIEQLYGLTEASPIITMSDSNQVPINVVGRLLPNISAIVKDPESNEILNPSEMGELWVKGPNVMKGYLNNDKATNEMFDNDGYMRTGDVGYFDRDEYLHIFDRAKDLFKYKGHQIVPSELEGALLTHKEVKDCCVLSVHNENKEDVPKAFIVLEDNDQDTSTRLKHIKEYVHNLLPPYKHLHGGIERVDSIPKSNAGKILRSVLRDQLKKKFLLSNKLVKF